MKEILSLARELNIEVLCLLETRVKVDNALPMFRKQFRGWTVLHNYSNAVNGRIWFLYRGSWQVTEICQSDQHITCLLKKGDVQLVFSAIYASNSREERLRLWKSLVHVKPQEPLKHLNWELYGGIHSRVLDFKRALDDVQRLVLFAPSVDSVAREKALSEELSALLGAEEKFLRQKSRVQFIKDGDKNSAYFFRQVAARNLLILFRYFMIVRGKSWILLKVSQLN
ncbi:hypothetical protein V6N13_118020 [Hibiscus sabdariffa]